jgi:hypothetical protein
MIMETFDIYPSAFWSFFFEFHWMGILVVMSLACSTISFLWINEITSYKPNTYLKIYAAISLAIALCLICLRILWIPTLRLELYPNHLKLDVPRHDKAIAYADLLISKARVIRYHEVERVKYRRGALFASMRWAKVGFFTTRDGKKRLMAVTDSTRILHIPTTQGYSIMVSVSEPEKLIQALTSRKTPKR